MTTSRTGLPRLSTLSHLAGKGGALARLRKFGGRCVLGFQSIAQVRSTYGEGEARTIVENCGNTLILRCSASEGGGTAQFASQLIGDREVVRQVASHSRGSGPLFSKSLPRDSTSVSEQHVVERAVLASEIEQLPDLAGFLKLASEPSWLRVDFRH
jgi:type IV secretory pathway TraG/TraD family ATPase VirD4